MPKKTKTTMQILNERRWNHFATPARTEKDIIMIREEFLKFSDLEEKDYRYLRKFLTFHINEDGYYYFQLETIDNKCVPIKRSIRNIFLENWELFVTWDGKENIQKCKKYQRDIREKYRLRQFFELEKEIGTEEN